MQVNAVKHNVLKCKNLNLGKNTERFFILIKYNVAYYLYFFMY